MFVGSEAIALAPLTDQPIYLEEGGLAVLTRSDALIDPKGRLQNLSAALVPETRALTLPRRCLRAAQGADGMFLVMTLSGAQAIGTVALIPDNAILPAAQVTQFWQFLETDIAAAEGGIRATLAALPASP